MRNLLAQVGHFFEAHVEKMVLGLAGLVCLYLLVTQVILGPDRVPYLNQSYSPGSIDDHVRRKADDVAVAFEREPAPKPPYRSRLTGPLDANDPVRTGIRTPLKGGFQELFGSTLGRMGNERVSPLPLYASTGPAVPVAKDRTYRLPEVGDIVDVKADHIRAAAYIPITPITPENPYQASGCEINDLDLVTVEAKYEVAGLVERFRESFTGDEVPAAWRDASLAEPVFVAVQLQRQQSLDDDRWGNWQDVPRCRVEARREMLKVSDTGQDSSAGGVHVRRIQFSNSDVLCDLLQPSTYQIASAYEDWLPPALHREYLDLSAKQKKEEQRQAREEERTAQEASRPDRRRSTDATGGAEGGRGDATGRGRRDATTGRGGADLRTGRAGTRQGRLNTQGYGTPAGPADRTRTARGGVARPGTGRQDEMMLDPTMAAAPGMETQMAISQVYLKFDQLRLTPLTDLTKLKELVFWAHDDTVEPGHRYRYQIRLGVLNPVAGTDQVAAANQEQRNQMILWSRFSDATPVIDIPARRYFFAKDFRENSGEVGIEVCKFILGYWRSQDFSVRPGEAIGRPVEKPKDSRTSPLLNPMMGMGDYATTAQDQVFQPAEIDYGTGVIFVAVSRVDGWTGDNRLRPQPCYDMLYSPDGLDIQRTPIGTSNWSTEQSNTYGAIRKVLKDTPIEPPRSWSQDVTAGAGAGGGYGGAYGAYGGARPGMPMGGGARPMEGGRPTPRGN